MNVLTYNSAKKQIIFMALYFVITGIVIRLIGYSLEGSLSALTQASIGNLLSGNLSFGDMFQFDFSFDTSQFDGFSFNTLVVFVKDKIQSVINDMMPTTLGAINMLMLNKYFTIDRAIKLGIKLY
ncbi:MULTISPECIES: hypothetical protein [Bacillus cereus group]|uniref:hypothetical protein n=1 Tax=Bacillus paranthracis TaxID=2026186 RepID=UPI0021D0790A|nr:hypothetical protein [Bacillus paranthracis]MCU5019676.1 hypothetical protein [Bacillus paranthracis]HDR4368599.1 hypothetical protein [Bacillus cereus]